MAAVISCRETLASVLQRAQPLSLVAIITLGTLRRLPVLHRRKGGMTSSPHGPYVQGDTRAKMAGTKSCVTVMWSKCQRGGLSSEWTLQRETKWSESLVTADQHAAVNTYTGPVDTARHTTGVDWYRRA